MREENGYGGKRGGGDLTAVEGMTPSLRAATPARAGEQFKRLYRSERGGVHPRLPPLRGHLSVSN